MVEESDAGNSPNEEFYYPSLQSGESSNHEGDEDYTQSYNLEDDNHRHKSHNSASDLDTKKQQNQHHVHGPDNHDTSQGDFYQDHEDETSVNSEDQHRSVNATLMEKPDNSGEHFGDKESVHDDVSDNNGDEKFSGIVEMTETIEESLKENKEDEDLPIQGKVLPPSDSVFSVEIPIYDPNKATSRFKDEDGENVNAEKIEVDSIDDDDQVNEKPNDNTTTKTDTVTKSLTINVTPEIIDKSNDSASVDNAKNNRRNFVDNEPFHQAVLHTALFHLDEDKLNLKPKPVATTIIIEDQDFKGFKGVNEQEYLNRAFPYQSTERSEKKMKILKNDRVMNMKATFTPPEKASKSAESINSESTYDLDDSTEINIFNTKSARKPAAPRHRSKNVIQHDGGNKTSNEWKLRLRKNKDEDLNTTKYLEDKYPGQASSNKNVNLSAPNNYKEYPSEIGKFVDKPRSLSSSSFLPNFEDFLKTILTNVQRLNTEQNSGTRNKQASPSRMASEIGINYANSINQLIPPPSTLPTLPLEQDSSQFRKRTFNTEHDFLDFPSSNQDFSGHQKGHQTQNYFNHLLGQYPTVGAIGNPSSMGASLSNYYSPAFTTASPTSSIPQYDINPSSTTGISQYAPGIVPLDLASSFIQAGIPKNQQVGYGQQQQPGHTPPYEFNNLYGSFPQFPLPSVPRTEGIGSVTTYNGQPPTYNSISQGMQLLNIISGTIPSSYYHDQIYNPTPPTPSSFQSDPFTVSPQFNFGSGSTTSSFGLPNIGAPPSTSQSHEFGNIADINTPQSSPPPFLALHPFDYHHPHPQEHTSSTDHPHQVQERQPTFQSPLVARAYALKSDRDKVEKFLEEDDHDQQPAASSFSRSILTTIKRPKISGIPVGPQQTTTAGSIVTLFSKPKTKTASIFKTPADQRSSPNSFSFEILPHKNRKSEVNPSANSVFNDEDPTFDVSGSTSRKKSGANPEKSWNMFSSHPNTINGQNENNAAEKYTPSRRKSIVRRIKTNRPNVGLKPGFYTR